MNHRLFFRFLSIFCIVLAFAFLGCGDDDDDDDNNDTDGITRVDPDGGPDIVSGPNILEGEIMEDLTLTADREHVLRGAVFVKNGATLTIEPGTTIFGEGVSNGTPIVAQGAKIIADGTSDQPIVFTSDALDGS